MEDNTVHDDEELWEERGDLSSDPLVSMYFIAFACLMPHFHICHAFSLNGCTSRLNNSEK